MAIYDYKTEPLTDFTNPKNVQRYKDGLSLVRSYLGETYPLIIGGERVKTDDLYTFSLGY